MREATPSNLMKRYEYKDYDEYVTTQIETTTRKAGRSWAKPESIKAIAKELRRAKFKPKFGLCHGVRGGEEIVFFKRYFKHCQVWGTDIAPICKNKNVIIWDFHNERREWKSRFDFIYSNSWDHLFDPVKGLKVWAAQVSVGGYLILEHSEQHIEKKVDIVDSIGMEYDEFVKFVQATISRRFKLQKFDGKKYIKMPFRHGRAVIWRRTR
jgi:hypothetical protein